MNKNYYYNIVRLYDELKCINRILTKKLYFPTNIDFTGANVHAVDINPKFIDLVNERCSKKSMNVVTEISEFDTFQSDKKYDCVFFYECLHHYTNIIKTLKHISKFIQDDGCIIFADKPVTSARWKHWSMHLDPLSVYCIQKYGWFETRWSENYLKNTFNKIGWKLWLIAEIGLDHGYIGLAVPKTTPDKVLVEKINEVIPQNWQPLYKLSKQTK